MAVSLATLKSDVWKTVYDVIKADEHVRAITERIYSAYPAELITPENEDALASILPMVVINPPDIDEMPITLTNTKEYGISFDIEIIVGETSEISKKLKEISDALLKALNDGESTLQDNGLHNFVVAGNRKDYDTIEGNKVYYDIITVTFTHFGG